MLLSVGPEATPPHAAMTERARRATRASERLNKERLNMDRALSNRDARRKPLRHTGAGLPPVTRRLQSHVCLWPAGHGSHGYAFHISGGADMLRAMSHPGLAVAVVAVAAALAGCSTAAVKNSADYTSDGKYGIGVHTFTFVDSA